MKAELSAVKTVREELELELDDARAALQQKDKQLVAVKQQLGPLCCVLVCLCACACLCMCACVCVCV